MGNLTKKVTVKADRTKKDTEHFIYCPYIPCAIFTTQDTKSFGQKRDLIEKVKRPNDNHIDL